MKSLSGGVFSHPLGKFRNHKSTFDWVGEGGGDDKASQPRREKEVFLSITSKGDTFFYHSGATKRLNHLEKRIGGNNNRQRGEKKEFLSPGGRKGLYSLIWVKGGEKREGQPVGKKGGDDGSFGRRGGKTSLSGGAFHYEKENAPVGGGEGTGRGACLEEERNACLKGKIGGQQAEKAEPKSLSRGGESQRRSQLKDIKGGRTSHKKPKAGTPARREPIYRP